MKIPRTRHQKVKQLKPWLSVYQDKRSTNESKFEGSAGGAGFQYWGTTYAKPKVDKNTNRMIRKASSILASKEGSAPVPRTNL